MNSSDQKQAPVAVGSTGGSALCLDYILLYGKDADGDFRRIQISGEDALDRARKYAAELSAGPDGWAHTSASAWDERGDEHNITAMLSLPNNVIGPHSNP